MINVQNVTKRYTTAAGDLDAISQVNIDIAAGEFVLITGRSGAGKSTLLGIMGGLIRPSSGQSLFDGESIWQLDNRRRAIVRAEKIGFVFQNASVIDSLTVIDNVILPTMFLPHTPSKDNRSRAMQLLDMVELSAKADIYPGQLSGGEKRRVAIASAMMNQPKVLFADEPTGDLDSETETRIIDCFAELKTTGTTVVMVSHNRRLAATADRMFEMTDGAIEQVLSRRTSDTPLPLDDFRSQGKASAS